MSKSEEKRLATQGTAKPADKKTDPKKPVEDKKAPEGQPPEDKPETNLIPEAIKALKECAAFLKKAGAPEGMPMKLERFAKKLSEK